jgi:hypothetical protein
MLEGLPAADFLKTAPPGPPAPPGPHSERHAVLSFIRGYYSSQVPLFQRLAENDVCSRPFFATSAGHFNPSVNIDRLSPPEDCLVAGRTRHRPTNTSSHHSAVFHAVQCNQAQEPPSALEWHGFLRMP